MASSCPKLDSRSNRCERRVDKPLEAQRRASRSALIDIGVAGVVGACVFVFAANSAFPNEETDRLIDKLAERDLGSLADISEGLEVLSDDPDPVAIQRLSDLLSVVDESLVEATIVLVLRRVALRHPDSFKMSVESLRKALPRLSPRVRPDLIRLIGELGQRSVAAVETLRDIAREGRSNSLYDRAWASAAILRIENEDERSLDYLCRVCASENRKERVVGFATLSFSNVRSQVVLTTLRNGLADPAVEVRTLAARGLQVRGIPPAEFLPVLRKAIQEPWEYVITQPYYRSEYKPTHLSYATGTIRALGRDARDAVPELIGILNRADDLSRIDVRAAQLGAISALEAIGPDATAALETLRKAAESEILSIRAASTAAIAAIEGKQKDR